MTVLQLPFIRQSLLHINCYCSEACKPNRCDKV